MPENNTSEVQILHPASRQLFRYWETLRAEDPCPNRRDFDLKVVKSIVPHLMIVERQAHTGQFGYRLAGTGIVADFGFNPTGCAFLEGWDDFESKLLARVLTNAHIGLQPAIVRTRNTYKSGQVIGHEQIFLPFSVDTSTVKLLIGGTFGFTAKTTQSDPATKRELVTVRSIRTEFRPGDALLRNVEQRGSPLLRVIEGGRSPQR